MPPPVASSVAVPVRRLRWSHYVWLVLEKDLRIELATKEIVTTAGFFAVLLAVLVSVAFTEGAGRNHVAPGVFWVSISFAAVLALGRSWHREREEAALTGMLLSPLPRSAIFAGKALGIGCFLGVVELLVLPVTALLFSLDLLRVGGGLLAVAAVATPGIAASGTLFGAMTVRTRARDLVLATVMFPLLSPTLLAAVACCREVIAGERLRDLTDYFVLMGVFDAVFVAGGLALFDALLQE